MFLRYSFFPLESLPLIAIPSWFYFFCCFWLVFFYLHLTFHPPDHPGHVIIVKLPTIVICLFFCTSWRFQFPSWIQWSCRMMMSQDCLRPQFFCLLKVSSHELSSEHFLKYLLYLNKKFKTDLSIPHFSFPLSFRICHIVSSIRIKTLQSSLFYFSFQVTLKQSLRCVKSPFILTLPHCPSVFIINV